MRLLAIDGNSIVNRAYYGVKALSNHKGIFTNAIFGFMNIYLKEAEAVKPDRIAICFDLKSPTFRHKAVASYKANRKGMPEELAMQMPYLKQLLGLLGIPILSLEGYEADDLLGTLASLCEDASAECIVMTGDRDSLQLVSDRVTVHLVTNRETIPFTPEQFQETYGFPPISLIDLKALMGDSSDNIAGVKGIGEKTATALIQQWQTIEAMYEHIEDVQATPRIRQKLLDGRPDAEQSKWLATICRDVPLQLTLDDLVQKPMQEDDLRRLLTELEMYKLLERFHLAPLASTTSEEQLELFADEPETLELKSSPWQAAEVLALPQPIAYTLREGTLLVCAEQTVWKTTELSEILDFLHSDAEKATDDAKAHYHFALQHGTTLAGLVFDAAVCGYLLNPSASDYSTAALSAQLGVPYHTELGEAADVQALQKLAAQGIARLEQDGMLALWQDIELPLTRVLASMEHHGILVDQEGIRTFGEGLSDSIADLQQQIYALAGEDFNIASPKQLGHVLFEVLELPAKKKTKSGYSTNAEVLEELRPLHPIIDLILQYRQYTKLQSTYVDGLLKTVGADGRIHTNYKQTETRTGRISSTEPNLQNIPVRTELGRNMRKFFQAQAGCVLLDADYSQIELRLMAHLSGDAAMQEAFRSGADIHTATAAKVFGMPADYVTSEMRSAAKAVNFGILYGMGPFSLAKDIHVTQKQAKQYIQDYLGSYPKVSGFLEDVVAQGTEKGYVCTLFGRRRYVPELSSKNKMMQAAGKRIAMNTPVQGTAADIIKLAMVRVHDRLAAEVPAARLLLQVHDELIVEVPLADADRAAVVLQEEMERVCELAVPLTADVNRGGTWYDAKG